MPKGRPTATAAVSTEADYGFQGTPAESLANWERLAEMWHFGPPPWRPSPGDIAVYSELAGSRLGGRVLILGVTPELRDGVAEAGGQAVLLDFSGAMHTAATSMLRRADAADETWIQDDWCGAALREGEFDLVVGDVSWWLVSVRKQHELRDAIHAALKTDGLFVNRFYVCDPTRVDQSPSAVLARFLGAIDREPDDEQALRGTMYSWLYDHTSDRAHQRLDRERAYALVLDLASLPEFSRHEEYLHAFAARLRGPDFTSQSREELVDVVGARFKVMGEGHAEDYDSSSFPIIALEPS